jgi:chromosome segregation ATPase
MDDQMKQIVSALKPLFDHINVKLEQMDVKFDHINAQFAQVKTKFDQMDAKFDRLDNRFERVESKLSDVNGTARRTAIVVAKLQEDVTDIKLEMATKRDISQQNGRLSALATEIENSRKERILAEKSYMRHEHRLDDHQERLSRLETRRRS